ncbi:unnamed protein product [Polarella glacialis]|uniref:Uncharacterized protein n=1 Tax=Polarella glacialis TaxID=89957 RepID=A0A813L0U1_POLGL|nr:unnamed protein product [Polarella glacialis]
MRSNCSHFLRQVLLDQFEDLRKEILVVLLDFWVCTVFKHQLHDLDMTLLLTAACQFKGRASVIVLSDHIWVSASLKHQLHDLCVARSGGDGHGRVALVLAQVDICLSSKQHLCDLRCDAYPKAGHDLNCWKWCSVVIQLLVDIGPIRQELCNDISAACLDGIVQLWELQLLPQQSLDLRATPQAQTWTCLEIASSRNGLS